MQKNYHFKIIKQGQVRLVSKIISRTKDKRLGIARALYNNLPILMLDENLLAL